MISLQVSCLGLQSGDFATGGDLSGQVDDVVLESDGVDFKD